MKKLLQLGCTMIVTATGTVAVAQWYPYYPPAPPPMYIPPPGYDYRQAPRKPERQEGADVRRAQQQLQKLGYHRGSIDGIAGSNTRSALARFQADHGLTPDGILGPATRRALDRRTGSDSGNRELSVRRERDTEHRAADSETRPRERETVTREADEQENRRSADTPTTSENANRTAAKRADKQREPDTTARESEDQQKKPGTATTELTIEPVTESTPVREAAEKALPGSGRVQTRSLDNTTSPTAPPTAVPPAAREATSEAQQPVPLDSVPPATPAVRSY